MVGRQVNLSFWENRPIFRGVFWLLALGSASRKCSNFRRWDFYSKQVFHRVFRTSSHVARGNLSHTSGRPWKVQYHRTHTWLTVWWEYPKYIPRLGVAKALQQWVHNLQYIHIYEGNPNNLDYPLFMQGLRYHHEPTILGVNLCRARWENT